MYQALYRVCRPEVFSEILGQEHIVKILTHQLKEDSVSHAYLFCGTRGTGKTTTARILAKGLNCLDKNPDGTPCGKCANCRAIKDGTFIDVIEIDAASNNGVDNIRELRESVNYPPQLGKKKVYIIDEVHMLSTGAFNALLKTLEEPPKDVIFILATTEPEKLPKTILSRCMRLDFKRVPEKYLYDGIKNILSERDITMDDGAIKLIINQGDGSVRDTLSILDQVISSGEKNISRDMALNYLGSVGSEFYINLVDKMMAKNTSDALLILDEALREGKEVIKIEKDLLSHYRNLLLTKFMKNPEDVLSMSTENISKLREQSSRITLSEINDAVLKLSKTINDSRYSTQSRILLELCIVELSSKEDYIDIKQNSFKEKTPLKTEVKTETQNVVFENPVETKKREDKRIVKENLTEENSELQNLWDEIVSICESHDGSYAVLRNGTTLSRIDEMTFLLYATSNFNKSFAEKKRAALETLMTRKIMRPMRMIVEVKTKEDENTSKDVEEMVKKTKETLGIDITVE